MDGMMCYFVIFDFPFRIHLLYKYGDIFKQYLPVTYIT